MAAGAVLDGRHESSICRISEGRERWRVAVQTWPEQDRYRGRLLFRRDDAPLWDDTRETAPVLTGSTREDVLSIAYEMPEDQLRRMLHSLG